MFWQKKDNQTELYHVEMLMPGYLVRGYIDKTVMEGLWRHQFISGNYGVDESHTVRQAELFPTRTAANGRRANVHILFAQVLPVSLRRLWCRGGERKRSVGNSVIG